MSLRVFLLSPANLRGVRGRRILEGSSGAAFMEVLAGGGRVPLGDVYESVSSLYYRGKRAYARRFARVTETRNDADDALPDPGVLVITPTRGLVADAMPVDIEELRAFAATELGPDNDDYVRALQHSALGLLGDADSVGEVVLLGSLASAKYLDPLLEVLGDRLLVPVAFVGRGDMSRGGLMLRCVQDGNELVYARAATVDRRGRRPPRLQPIRQEPTALPQGFR